MATPEIIGKMQVLEAIAVQIERPAERIESSIAAEGLADRGPFPVSASLPACLAPHVDLSMCPLLGVFFWLLPS